MKIALIGEAGVGKDYIADILTTRYNFMRLAFADEVKYVSRHLFPEVYGDGSSKNRELLQDVGMKMREIDPNVWVNVLLNLMYELESPDVGQEHFVITDTRMPNEYDALRDEGFRFVRITAPDDVRERRMADRGDVYRPESMNHVTERHYDDFECEYVIVNDGENDVQADVRGLLTTLLLRTAVADAEQTENGGDTE